MTPENFGKIALSMLSAASIPGAELDAAMAWREIAKGLAEGSLQIVERKDGKHES